MAEDELDSQMLSDELEPLSLVHLSERSLQWQPRNL
jgi:hypothetical protein